MCGLKPVAVDHVNGPVKKSGNVAFESDIVINGHVGLGVNLNHNVGVAVGAIVAARARTEQGGMGNPAFAQGALVVAKPVKDFLPVHALRLYHKSRPESTGK